MKASDQSARLDSAVEVLAVSGPRRSSLLDSAACQVIHDAAQIVFVLEEGV